MISKIINQFQVGVHEGYEKTFKCIRANFYRHGMRKHIKDFIKGCEVCQRHKVESLSLAGLLQPLPIPQKIWEDISMDFIEVFPNSKGKTTILVVVDRLSKYAYFLSLGHPCTAATVA